MEPISPQAAQRLEETVPELVALIREAIRDRERRTTTRPIQVCLDAFADDPITLYEWLWFAASEGIPVTFVPKDLPESSPPPRPSSGR